MRTEYGLMLHYLQKYGGPAVPTVNVTQAEYERLKAEMTRTRCPYRECNPDGNPNYTKHWLLIGKDYDSVDEKETEVTG